MDIGDRATARLPLPPEGRGVSQIGIVVHDIKEALRIYESSWGGQWLGFRYNTHTVPQLTYRGQPGEYELVIAINDATPQIELVQHVSGPSIYDAFRDSGRVGLHHLGYWVDSLDNAISSMGKAGYDVVQSGAGYGLDGDGGFAYFSTETDFGIILEAIEVPKRRRQPDFTWP